MPVHINLLAEAQAAEELRRRDPVKRVIYACLLAVAAMLVWSSTLQLKVMMANRELSQVQFQVASCTPAYDTALTNNARIASIKMKLADLQKLTHARMLQGNLLNALQKVNVDNVQLMHLTVDQAYIASGGKSPSVTERIVVTLDARDSSPNPGDQVGRYKDAIAKQPYFQEMLDKTNGIQLTQESSPQQDQDGKNYVLFTLECHFPDHKR